jgi:hypothetical protein
VKALSPSAAIRVRDALTGDTHAVRVRQLATPPWLSTRVKTVLERHAAPSALSQGGRQGSAINPEPAPRPEVIGFLACAPSGVVVKQDDPLVRAASLRTRGPSARRALGKAVAISCWPKGSTRRPDSSTHPGGGPLRFRKRPRRTILGHDRAPAGGGKQAPALR